MSSDISPENEQFIRYVITTGTFQDRGEALDKAVELLKRHQQLICDVNAGIEQLQRGEGKPLDIEAVKAKVAVRLEREESLHN